MTAEPRKRNSYNIVLHNEAKDIMQQLTYQDYERFRDLLHTRTGLIYRENKWRDLSTHLQTAIQNAGIDGWDSYYTQLRAASSETALWEDLVTRLTVGETYFFRNPAHFSALRMHILPSLIQRRRDDGQRLLRVWSAGCATGEEPYSLAILLRELIPDIDNWSIMILATDINRDALTQAAGGIYRERSFRADTPEYIRSRYFHPNGKGVELKPHIRQMVQFRYLNLVEDHFPSPASYTIGLDLIVCRNVTIYFTQEVTQRVAKQFNDALKPGGWLVVGHSEPQINFYDDLGFETRNFEKAVVYQKKTEEEAQQTIDEAPPVWDYKPVTPTKVSDGRLAPTVNTETNEPRLTNTVQEVPAPETEASSDSPASPAPPDAKSCFLRAKELADQMQWAEAHTWLGHALEQDPLLIEAYFMRALIYQHESDNSAALNALKRALYIDRNFVLGHFNTGMIHWQEGRTTAASRAWKVARALLQEMPPEEALPHGDGMLAGRLLSILNGYLEGGDQR